MNELNTKLAGFASASLFAFQQVQLFDRVDTKFIIPVEELPFFADSLQKDYTVLSIHDKRIHPYHSVYFDTPDLLFYQQHHRDKRSRFKVRKRFYNLTDKAFLEVKEKTNRGRTIKTRTPTTTNIEAITYDEKMTLSNSFNLPATDLTNALTVNYSRISLADFSTNQRLTIDTNLHFVTKSSSFTVNNWAIIEVKQAKLDRSSTALQTLKKMGIRPNGMSKYCLGTAVLKPHDVPVAGFRPFLKYFSLI